ncbi:MAG TPA: hypothetical protein VF841_05855 [Anaeromyxobacter sp.]
MPERERFFECVFVSERNEYQFHFRAWSEAEAERHFRETLRGYGISSPGTLLIRNAKGRLVRRADYTPSSCEDAST